jgi:PTH1 family peptidyl-tRNA hydrolase
MDATLRAMALAHAAGVVVDAADAGDWLAARLSDPRPDTLHLITHTIAWQYFAPAIAAACRAALEEAGARATSRTPLAVLGMEADGRKPGAGLTLRLWPGDVTVELGRTDFHGRWTIWDAPETG